MEKVLLVDENDSEIGYMEKMEAHKNGGTLHRAFSVFLYKDGKMLLQRRANSKYHCPGLWTNSCCSHPLSSDIKFYARKRLVEELGVDLKKINLSEVGSLTYKHSFSNGLTEYEFDHLLISKYDSEIFNLNSAEVSEIEWIEYSLLLENIEKGNSN